MGDWTEGLAVFDTPGPWLLLLRWGDDLRVGEFASRGHGLHRNPGPAWP